MKAGFKQDEVRRRYPRIGEVPFSFERKRMSTIHVTPEGMKVAYMKGAPEVVLERCTHVLEGGAIKDLTEDKRSEILRVNEEMAKDALRVLAVAYREVPTDLTEYSEENVERRLVFLSLVGIIDPPREEAIEVVKVCHAVKMKPVMITVDHKLTAIAIAKEMEIYEEGDIAITGSELSQMSDEEFEKIVDKVTVYARVDPIQKVRIVDALKKKGHVVAMAGDGVNDAPALKRADIGIAMGITGTEVTKEASSMVLADDNFATIVKAIEQGRWIYDNIKKYLTYLLKSTS